MREIIEKVLYIVSVTQILELDFKKIAAAGFVIGEGKVKHEKLLPTNWKELKCDNRLVQEFFKLFWGASEF